MFFHLEDGMENPIWIIAVVVLPVVLIFFASFFGGWVQAECSFFRFKREITEDYYIRPQLVWLFLENPDKYASSKFTKNIRMKMDLFGKSQHCFFYILDFFPDSIDALFSYPKYPDYHLWKKMIAGELGSSALDNPEKVRTFLQTSND